MTIDTLISQLAGFYQSYPFVVYAGIAAYILLLVFKRKAALKILIFLVFILGVVFVVEKIGDSFEAGKKSKQSVSQKTEKALN